MRWRRLLLWTTGELTARESFLLVAGDLISTKKASLRRMNLVFSSPMERDEFVTCMLVQPAKLDNSLKEARPTYPARFSRSGTDEIIRVQPLVYRALCAISCSFG